MFAQKIFSFLITKKIYLNNLTKHDRGYTRRISDRGFDSVYRQIASCLGSIDELEYSIGMFSLFFILVIAELTGSPLSLIMASATVLTSETAPSRTISGSGVFPTSLATGNTVTRLWLFYARELLMYSFHPFVKLVHACDCMQKSHFLTIEKIYLNSRGQNLANN